MNTKLVINIQNIRKFMEKKRIIYDYNADQKQFKWSGKGKLKKLKNKYLPKYVENNLKKYSYWLD